MSTLVTRPRTRLVAGAVATTLATGGLLALAPTPALAATSASLAWEVSQQFDDHLSTHVLGGGATEDADGVVSFPGGTATYDAATRATTVQYAGSVAGSFAFGGTTYYTVAIADPAVTVASDGSGRLSAVVSASNAASGQGAAASTSPARVTVATFAASTRDAAASTLAVTPDWGGVLPAGSAEATELGMADGKPVEGKAFAASFLRNLTSGVRPHFYASGSSSDPKKQVAAFTATVPGPAVSARVSDASPTAGLTVTATGTGFRGVTEPGDNGIYVGLAPTGGLPPTGSRDGMDAFVAATWIPASALTSGSFSTSLTAPTARLDRAKSYSVYTWQAHTRSNATQDTETPVAIDWSRLQTPATTQPTQPGTTQPTTPAAVVKTTPTVTTKVKGKPVVGRRAKLAVSLGGTTAAPTGMLEVTLTKKGAKKAKVVRTAVSGSSATVKLPKLTRGVWRVTVAYSGDTAYAGASGATKLTVKPRAAKK